MKKNILFLAMLIIFFGCSNKQYTKEEIKNEILAYTSKKDIITKDGRALIVGTYINPMLKNNNKKQADEKFIISINPKNIEIDKDNITINSKNIKAINKLNSDDESLKTLGFTMPWSDYYEIIASSQDSDKLRLLFKFSICENCQLEQVELEFQKVAKSLYWNQ
ncbi:hypothetical protein CPIN18021_1295 [Campylobacter pinnipediorum subsp. caledonicus]|uniref:Uncharacterized protein n=1 Tax=Campylobacter pinnipediorum subsp. caledonicus TaxID=1874362 RepID=A0A1S6U8R9_9BACT|nr:hypothetical protein [Campylobacter pinnipediorum]AQW88089.1 hypothetical protein CPIN18021_1295 [Campylobacter pinnipediorum subsp. caledonicus]OPA71532.1 hypothetical protein BB381_03295 [Campylobacter pinnipediorum subsp. caledonicus]